MANEVERDVPVEIGEELDRLVVGVAEVYDEHVVGEEVTAGDMVEINSQVIEEKNQSEKALVQLFKDGIMFALTHLPEMQPADVEYPHVHPAVAGPVSAPEALVASSEPLSVEAKLELLEGPAAALPRDIGDEDGGTSSRPPMEALFGADEPPIEPPQPRPAPQVQRPPAPAPVEWQQQVRAIQNLVVPYRDDPDSTIKNLSCSVLSLVSPLLGTETPEELEHLDEKLLFWDALNVLVFKLRAILRGLGKYRDVTTLQRDLAQELNAVLAEVMEMNIPDKAELGKEEEVEGEAETEVADGDAPSSD